MSAPQDLDALRSALASGGLAVVPTDTVYGLAASLASAAGVEALYRIKGRDRSEPCQVLLLGAAARENALGSLRGLERTAAAALLPGPATCIVGDPDGRYAGVAGREAGSVGLRAPLVDGELARFDEPLVATSANEPGGTDPASIEAVPERIRDAAQVVWDAGPLPGVASAVVDLRPAASGAPALLLRAGPDRRRVKEVLASVGVALV